MILNIASFPRSGNSCFASILLGFLPTWRDEKSRKVTFRPTQALYSTEADLIGLKKAPFLNLADFDRNPVPRIEDPDNVFVYKRHDDPDDYSGPRIYVVRDGRDVFCSLARHNLLHRVADSRIAQGQPPDHQNIVLHPEDVDKELLRLIETVDYSHFVKKGINHPNTVAVVHFRDMVTDPAFTVAGALKAAGYRVKWKGAPSFEQLRKFAPWFYRRGEIGSFQDEMSPEIQRLFVDKHGDLLKELDYL